MAKPVDPRHRRSTALVLREAAFTTVIDWGRTGQIPTPDFVVDSQESAEPIAIRKVWQGASIPRRRY
jgi:hypothetical protein